MGVRFRFFRDRDMKKYIKLANDYKWDTETDENGNVKDVYVYTGPLYEIDETKEEHAARRTRLLILSVLSIVFFVPPMVMKCVLAKRMLVVVPYAFNLFTVWGLIEAAVTYYRSKETLTRAQKEKCTDKLRISTFFGTVFFSVSTFAALAIIIKLIVTISVSDIIFICCDAILAGIFAYLLVYTRGIKAKETEKND